MACPSGCTDVIDSYRIKDAAGEQLTDVDQYCGQAFTMGGTAKDLCCASFNLYNNYLDDDSVTMEARLYASTGTVGTDAVPIGDPLAVSESKIMYGDEYQGIYYFGFLTPYTLEASTDYCIVLYVTATNGITGQKYLNFYVHYTSPTHPGNFCSDLGADNSKDSWFEIYAEPLAGWTGKINNITNPAKVNGIAVANIAKINNI